MSSSVKIPLLKAICLIVISLLLVSSVFFLGFVYYKAIKKARSQDPQYTLGAIVQSCSSQEPLKTSCLAEILGLCIDRSVNLYAYDVEVAKKRLLNFSPIKKAAVKKICPGTLFIEYSLREPLAYIADFNNAAIDAKGVLMPFNPFFTPKNIPSIYLGLKHSLNWGVVIESKELQVAFHLINIFHKHFSPTDTTLISLDVSLAFSLEYGKREIIVTLKERAYEASDKKSSSEQLRFLRLSCEHYLQQLANYKALGFYLAKNFEDEAVIIDMRLLSQAFISKVIKK